MLEINHLSKDYQSGSNVTHALQDVCLTFPNSGFVAILGPSGCGKSTFLNMLGLLDKPTSGEITIDGLDISKLDDAKIDEVRNQKIGFIFQSYHLIPTLSILDNVTLPLEIAKKGNGSERKKKAIKLLKQVGLENLINKKVNELSGGQRQRVAICRALINDPEIILADEPTGALDIENSKEVLNILKEISRNHLVIFVTHNNEQANTYSDYIIRLADGKVVDHPSVFDKKNTKLTPISTKKSSFLMGSKSITKISAKSFLAKKAKTFLTSVANCFGLVSLGFVLALTNGFSIYKDKVDSETASNLPINVPSYSVKSNSESWKDINSTTEYPNSNEIYPYVSTSTTYTYTYNHFNTSYFDFLDSLVEDGLASEYLFNYGNSYSYNLTTTFPASIDGTNDTYVGEVTTSLSAGGSYTSSTYGIPTNIFHVLYGDIDSGYDLIAGELPKEKDQLVLVVNEYNSISFSTLQYLGFYNEEDTQEDVKDATLSSKVKPISFDDIVGKTYKIFSNDELYNELDTTYSIKDQFSYHYGTSSIGVSYRTIKQYEKNDIEDLYNDETKGETLTITGIIRPKENTTLSLLSPSLCYLEDLQDTLNSNKNDSKITNDLVGNVVYLNTDSPTDSLDLVNDVNAYFESINYDYGSVSATDLNEIANKYFTYYRIDDGSRHKNDTTTSHATYRTTNFSSFLTTAKKFGASLLLSETEEALNSGDNDKIIAYVRKTLDYFTSRKTADEAYSNFISLMAFANSYSDITNISVFPNGLSERTKILNLMDEYNDSMSNENDKVYYLDVTNYLVENVGDMISLVSFVLMIFVGVLLTVACVMNILFTYNSVLERKKDIGIFRAVGMKKFDVSRIFLFEASLIGLLSGVMGVIFTLILEIPVNNAVKEMYSTYYRIGNICVLSWWHVILLIGLGLILGLVSSIIPSYSAANKDPIKCLKDE